jgi:transcriptional regulator GlxA family with amidase domain
MNAMARTPTRQIAVVLYPGVTALDVVGTMEVLMALHIRSPYRVVTVGERIEPIRTDTSLTIVPQLTFAELDAPFGLIVPGGGQAALSAGCNDAFWSYVQAAGARAELLAGTGTGALILAQAGLLEGRRATTHWAFARHLEEYGARYVRRRWVDDGGVITAAGVSAGIDMALYLVAKLTTVSKARLAQLIIEYDPQPPFGGIDWDRVDQEQAARRRATNRANATPLIFAARATEQVS